MVSRLKSKYSDLEYGSQAWANDSLNWFIAFLKEDTWRNHPYFKVIVGWNIEDILRCAGYKWQAERVLNHLHRWQMSCRLGESDTLDLKRERGDS